ncbi:hypothetical protein KIW84_012242 [Lathyrus oleraceus]|uniref:Uncharacterized protein n=1 Tax=Pisum sativum TaxID=3888 RepID=A0A9D5GW99_PEA|nr:hypothetical protein KIW84_012242 [Pisum sativum]
MVHTPAENGGGKGKSILADKLNTMGFEGTSISMEVDNVMADAEDIIVDNEKTLVVVSETEDSIENSDFVNNTQRISIEKIPETNPDLHQDMRFLNSFWDNMVHQELAKQGIGDNVVNSLGVDSQGFKKVKSKSKRTTQKNIAARTDFNIILGSHEYDGTSSPARGPMEDFVTWTDQNHLIDMPIVSSKFTWSNGRSGPHHTRKRLHKD